MVKVTSGKPLEGMFPGLTDFGTTANNSSRPGSRQSVLPWPTWSDEHGAESNAQRESQTAFVERRVLSRVRRPPSRYGEWAASAVNVVEEKDPSTYRQMLKSPNRAECFKAMEAEFQTLVGRNTWELVPRPARRKIIRSKWVFRTKHNADRSLDKLKARLVAMGFTQVKGIDYDEVFLPTSRQESLRLLITLMASRDWEARQVDFTAAFLNGKLNEELFMAQPEGFVEEGKTNWVCQLIRSIYGLKQSPRAWNAKLHDFLVSAGLTQSSYDPSLYFCITKNTLRGLCVVHVDDVSITGENGFVSTLRAKMKQSFKVSADKLLSHFLSLEITRDRKSRLACVSQANYISDLMKQNGIKPLAVQTPTSTTFKNLMPSSSKCLPSSPFASLIGGLLWISQCSRPDVAFAIN